MVAPRALFWVTGILVVPAAVLVALLYRGSSHPPEDAPPSREVSRPTAASPRERAAVPPPALPPPAPASAALAERPSTRAETKLVLTQIKLQKYVEEAYPAWLRAHPGQDCPRQLSELTEYMEDKDSHDAWGRPLRMRCSASWPGKRLKVISYGRDGERSEDDVRFESQP